MKQGTINRISGRKAQISKSSRGTYVKPPRMRRSVFVVNQALRGLAAVTALQLTAPAFALPTGESLQFGGATVARPTATQMDITQTTSKAGLNWTSFSIAQPETVNVLQPSSSSVLLNRVVGSDQSQIFGALNANGRVFLVNPNGILFAPGAAVNVGGLVASTLDITDANFQAGGTAGNPYVFTKGATAGNVVNQGNITITVPDSYAALLGTQASNEGAGTITAVRGTVALAAGEKVTLNILGDNLINVSVDQAAAGALALNSGSIIAAGGTIFLTARSADALLGTVINNSGLIKATSLTEVNGRIFLDGGAGNVVNSGTLDATGSGGSVNSTGGAFSNTGTIAATGATVDINHTGTVTIEGGISAASMSVTGGGVDITNSGAGFAVNAAGTQTLTATQDNINVTNSGTGLLTLQVVGDATVGGVQTFNAQHGDINISSSGAGGVTVQALGPVGVGGTQTFDTVTGALAGSTGSMTVKGTGGDVLVSTQGGTQTIKLLGNLTVGDAAATKSTELAFNRFQDVKAAAISVIGGAGNTAGATLHSFGGQTIVTGNLTLTGGTAPAFTVIPGFGSSPSASILNNTTGTQDITATAINITGGTAGSGNSAGIGNFANSAQKITADSITLTGGASTNANAFIQSGSQPTVGPTTVGTMEVHTNALTLTGQTSNATIGGGPGSSTDITVTGNTTLTGDAAGGSAVIGLLGTTTNAAYSVKFTGTGDLSLQGGTGATPTSNPGSAHIGAGSNHTNPTVDIDVKAANITLTAGNNNGGAFIGNSNNQTTVGGGNISVAATAGNLVMNTSLDGTQRSAIRSVGGTHRSVSLSATGNIDATGGRVQVGSNLLGGNLTTHSDGNTTFGLTTVGGNLLATATGSITNTQTVTVTGAGSLNMTAGDSITINNDVSTAGGLITLDAATSLTNNATISNGGGANTALITLRANAYDLDGSGAGQVQGGAAAVLLTPHTTTNSLGIVSPGDTTVAQSDIDAIHTTNFVTFGSSLTGFTGNTVIGETALVNGNGKNLAFLRSNLALGTATTTIGAQGVSTTGDLIVNAGPGSIVSNGGTLTGNRVHLTANRGIGTPGARINTAANTLAAGNGNVAGGVFISEADAVSLAALTLNLNQTLITQSNVGGPAGYDLTAAGTITVGNLGVNSASLLTGPTTLTTTGAGHNIEIAGGNIGNQVSPTTLTSGGSIISVGAGGTVRGTNVTLDSTTGVGTVLSRINAAATTLAARSTTSGEVFVAAQGPAVTLATIGTVANTAAGGAAYDVQASTITVGTGGVNTGGTGSTTLTAIGPASTISIGANDVGNAGSATTLVSGGNITGTTGTVRGTDVALDSVTGVGVDADNRVNTSATTLAARSVISGGVFIAEADSVSLATTAGATNSAAGGGAYDLLAGGAISVNAGGVVTTNGRIALNGTSLTNNATITNNGGAAGTANIVLRADAFDLDGSGAGQVQGGAAAVVVTPRTNTNSLGIVSAGDTTVAQSDLDAIHTTNFVVLGSANLGFTGNTTIGQDALVNGNGKSLAFFHALGPSTTTIGAQGVSTIGDIAITSGNIVSNGGTITGSQVQLVADTGIGASGERINTSANTLAANNNGAAGSGIFISEASDVSLARFTLNVGGNANTQANLGGAGGYNLTAAGTITVGDAGVNSGASNGLQSTGATTLTTTGANHNIVIVGGGNVGNLTSATTLTSAGNITGTGGVVQGTAVTLDSATGIGTGPLGRVNTAATTLAARSTSSGGVFVAEADGVSLNTINTVANGAAGGGAYDVFAVNPGSMTVDGGITTTGTVTLSSESLTNNSLISNSGGGLVSLFANTFNLAGTPAALVDAGTSAINVRPRTTTNSFGIGSVGQQTTLQQADIDRLQTSQFIVFGSGLGNYTGNMTIAANTHIDGGSKDLAFLRTGDGGTVTVGAQGVSTTGDLAVSAGTANANGGGSIISNGGLLAGDNVQVRAKTGIGTLLARVNTAAHTLSINNDSGGAFVTQLGDVSLKTLDLNINNVSAPFANFGGSGGYNLRVAGAASVDGNITTTTGQITIGANSLTNHAVISNDGTSTTANIALLANAFNLVGGTVNAGQAAAVLAPLTPTNSFGIEDASAQTHVTNADIATVNGAAVVFGSPLTGIFTGNMTIGVDHQVQGGNKNLAFLRDPNTATTGTITIGANGLTTTGNVAIGAGGHGSIVSSGGTIAGNLVSLTAAEGIGTSLARVLTSANTLAVSNAGNLGSGAFVTEANDVTLANVSLSAGGITLNTTNTGGTGAYDVKAGDTITVGTGGVNAGLGSTGTTSLETTAGDILIGANVGNLSGATTLISANTITGTGVVSGSAVSLSAAGDIGSTPNPINVDAGTLNFNSPGTVAISEGNDTVLTGLNSAGSLSLTSGGAISEAAGTTVAVTNNASFAAGTNAITLDGTNNFGSLTFHGGAVSIVEADTTQLAGASTASSLSLTSGGEITEGISGTLSVTGNASFSAGAGGITLFNVANGGNNFGSLTFNTTGDVTISETSSTVLSGSNTAGGLTLSSGGSITDNPGTSIVVTGGASLNANGSINLADDALDVLSVGANAAFTAFGGGITIGTGGAVNLGSLSATAFSGDISVKEASGLTSLTVLNGDGNVNIAFGADSLTYTAAGHALNFGAPATNVAFTNLQSIELTGANTALSLALQAGGAITEAAGATVTVTNNASFSSGNDAITLTNAGNNFGSLSFAGGAVTIREASDTQLAGFNNASSLSLTSGGALTDAAGTGLRVNNNAGFSGASIDLGNAAGDVLALGSLTFNSPGAVKISQDSSTVLSGTSTAGSLTLISGDTITNAPGTNVTVAGTADLTGTSITLADHATDVLGVGTGASFLATTGTISIGNGGTASSGTLNFNAPGDVSIHQTGNTVLTGANTAPNVILSSTGSLTDAPNTSLVVAGNASLSGASITLGDNAGDTTNFGTLSFNSTGAVSIHESSDTALTGTNTANSLSLSSAGSITDVAGTHLSVASNASLSGSSITLGTGPGDVVDFGTLTFNSAGAVTIQESSSTVLSGSSTADSLRLIVDGLLTNAPATSLNVTQNANLSAENIALGGNAGDALKFGSLTFNSGGTVSISQASDMVLAGANTALSLELTAAGAITDAPATTLNVTGNATTLGNASFTGTSITLADSAGDSLVVRDNASFKATTGGITVGDAGFANFGSLTFNSPAAVVVQEDCCMQIAGVNSAGSLNLTSSEGITNTDHATIDVTGNASFTGTSILLANNATNALTVGGTASFTATTGNVTVGTGNVANFNSLTFNAPGAVSIREGSDTAITGSNTAGSLVLSSAGAITEVGTSIAVTGNANLSGTSINLGNNAGDTVNFGSLTFSSTGAVSISEDSATVLSGSSTAGSLTLASAGTVTQTGPLTVTGAGSISAGSNAITLTNANNDFVGTLTLTGGTVKLTDKNGLSVVLHTGETYIIANAGGGSADLVLGGASASTTGNLTAVSNGGTVIWNNLSGANVILIAATPSVGAAGITGLNPTTGDLLPLNTTFSNRGDARGTNLVASGELYIVARDIPGAPADSSAKAAMAVLDIAKLNPENRLQLILDAPNGKLRLLVDNGAFRFRGGSQFPGGVSVPDPKKTQVFVGNLKLDATPDAAFSAASAAKQSALNSASADARQSFGTDSVTQQIDMGFAGDVGIAPTMAHNVPLQGEIISTPEGVTESKGGQ